MHCSRVVSALMACLEIMLWFALHVKCTPGGLVIDAASIGSLGSCAYTTCWITGIIVFGIIVRGIIVRVNIGNNSASGIIVFGIIVCGIIACVNIGWGLFDGNNFAFGIIVRLFVIDAVRIGSSGSCAYTTCWIA